MRISGRGLFDRFPAWRWVLCAMAAILVAALSTQALAAQGESYDYDGLGRLVRVISSTGVVTEYVYDAAGNITAVTRGAQASPPTLTAVTPTTIRRGDQVRVTLTGANLQNAALQAVDRELTISGVTRAPTSLSFDLAASLLATVGPSALRVSSAAGSASIDITVRPPLPTAQLSPLPIAVPPDGRSAAVDLVLSNVDDQAHTVALSTVRPDIATVSPASVTIPAGSTKATFFVTGRAGGNTELRLESASLGSSAYPIFVLAAFEGINTARANLVGVTLAGPAVPPAGINGLFAAVPVGVVRGSTVWLDTAPRYVAQGSAQTLQIIGTGLPGTLSVALQPADGISLGPVTVAPDGGSATVQITADANAALGPRRLTVSNGGAVLSPVVAGADSIDVVAPLPVITSVQPIVLAPGSTVPTFEVRGRNLQDVVAVEFVGGGVSTGATLTANPEGTLLQFGLQVSIAAEPGPRTVVLVAPAGRSSSTPTALNTITVANEGEGFETFPDVSAPLVGVVKQVTAPPAETTLALTANTVGLVVGPVAVSSQPASIARTETITLNIHGQYLGAVSAVTITPSTGLTVGASTVSPDGKVVSVSVTAAADAPLGGRRIELLEGAAPVRVAGLGALSLLVTPLTPILESVDPNSAVPSGIPFELTLRGRNLLGATAVRFTPSAGITVGTLAIDESGTEIKVSVTVALSATRGARTVTVLAPAGESSSKPGPNNQFTVAEGIAVFGLPSPLVGLQVGPAVVEPPPVPVEALVGSPLVGVSVGPFFPSGLRDTVFAPHVGVTLANSPSPTEKNLDAFAPVAGVARGPVVTRIEPQAWVPGQSGVLVVRGLMLPAGSTLQIRPAGVVSLAGQPTVDADGTAVRQEIVVAGSPEVRRLSVDIAKPDGSIVPLASAQAEPLTLYLLPGLPNIISLDTILARQGDTVDLLIRGTNLGEAIRVTADPASGLDIAPDFTVNAAGTELLVKLFVRDDAALGARVIRVFNRLGGSSALAEPANTFTVFPKE